MISRQLNDVKSQPIHVMPSTRMQVTRLEKKFYRELEPFRREDMMWTIFAWRVQANLHDQ